MDIERMISSGNQEKGQAQEQKGIPAEVCRQKGKERNRRKEERHDIWDWDDHETRTKTEGTNDV